MNFMLDYPGFACHAMIFSPAGKIPKSWPEPQADQDRCGRYFLGAGEFDGVLKKMHVSWQNF